MPKESAYATSLDKDLRSWTDDPVLDGQIETATNILDEVIHISSPHRKGGAKGFSAIDKMPQEFVVLMEKSNRPQEDGEYGSSIIANQNGVTEILDEVSILGDPQDELSDDLLDGDESIAWTVGEGSLNSLDEGSVTRRDSPVHSFREKPYLGTFYKGPNDQQKRLRRLDKIMKQREKSKMKAVKISRKKGHDFIVSTVKHPNAFKNKVKYQKSHEGGAYDHLLLDSSLHSSEYSPNYEDDDDDFDLVSQCGSVVSILERPVTSGGLIKSSNQAQTTIGVPIVRPSTGQPLEQLPGNHFQSLTPSSPTTPMVSLFSRDGRASTPSSQAILPHMVNAARPATSPGAGPGPGPGPGPSTGSHPLLSPSVKPSSRSGGGGGLGAGGSNGLSGNISVSSLAPRASSPDRFNSSRSSTALQKIGISTNQGTAENCIRPKIREMKGVRDAMMTTTGCLSMLFHPDFHMNGAPDVAETVSATKKLAIQTISRNRVDHQWSLLTTPGYSQALSPEQRYQSETMWQVADSEKLRSSIRKADLSKGLKTNPVKKWSENAARSGIKLFVAGGTFK